MHRKFFSPELLIPILLVISVAVIAYVPFTSQMSFYGDDWLVIWGGHTIGPAKIADIYSVDRPFGGLVTEQVYKVLGDKPIDWQLYMVFLRTAGALVFLWIARMLWPKHTYETTAMAVLYAVYPGFLTMPMANSYSNLMTGVDFGVLSMAMTVAALRTRSPWVRGLCLAASALFSAGTVFMIEWMIGFEGIRMAILFIWFWRDSKSRLWNKFLNTLKYEIPGAIGALSFVVWRLFLFHNQRAATDIHGLIHSYVDQPFFMTYRFIFEWLKGIVEIIFAAWITPLYNLVINLGYPRLAMCLLAAGAAVLVVFGAIKLFSSASSRQEDGHAPDEAINLPFEAFWIGLASVALSIIPLIVSYRGVVLGNTYDRYTMTAMFGAAMVAGAFIFGVIHRPAGRLLAFVLLVGFAVTTHTANSLFYSNMAIARNQFWWQLAWRAPSLKDNTVLVPLLANPNSFMDDYDSYPEVNLIYRPGVSDIQIGTQILNRDTAPRIIYHQNDDRTLRTTYFMRDYNNALVVNYGYDSGTGTCLHAYDGKQPELSMNENPLIPLVAGSSNIDQIDVNGPEHTPQAEIFGSEPQHNWCYYYEKASLARQSGDWVSVTQLADEALSHSFHPVDSIEWMPMIEGYANIGRLDDARNLISRMKGNATGTQSICRLFSTSTRPDTSYANAEAHSFIQKTLCNQ
jgi:hypothetical protein